MNPKSILTSALLLSFTFVNAQNLPLPSPKSAVSQNIGLAEVEVTYSRPSANGRTIWGDVVPLDKIWRTGANAATTFKTTDELSFGGCKLAPGTYSIFTVPGKTEWQVMLNSDTNLWGTGNYKKENEICSVKASAKSTSEKTESFTIKFDNITNTSASLTFAWENLEASVKIENNPVPSALANIEKAIKDVENPAGTYNNAANFYIDFNLDSKKAVEYAEKAIKNGGSDKFWIVTTLSKAYAADKQYKKAIEEATKSLDMAKKANYDPYIKINEENIAKWKKM